MEIYEFLSLPNEQLASKYFVSVEHENNETLRQCFAVFIEKLKLCVGIRCLALEGINLCSLGSFQFLDMFNVIKNFNLKGISLSYNSLSTLGVVRANILRQSLIELASRCEYTRMESCVPKHMHGLEYFNIANVELSALGQDVFTIICDLLSRVKAQCISLGRNGLGQLDETRFQMLCEALAKSEAQEFILEDNTFNPQQISKLIEIEHYRGQRMVQSRDMVKTFLLTWKRLSQQPNARTSIGSLPANLIGKIIDDTGCMRNVELNLGYPARATSTIRPEYTAKPLKLRLL